MLSPATVAMVELVNQREGPVPRRRVQREREDRVAGRRRRRHRVGTNRIAQRNAARRQIERLQRRNRIGGEPIGQRLVRAGLEQPRHRAGRNRDLAGNVADAASNAVARASVRDAFNNAVLVNRPGRRCRAVAIGVSSLTVITRPVALPVTESPSRSVA